MHAHKLLAVLAASLRVRTNVNFCVYLMLSVPQEAVLQSFCRIQPAVCKWAQEKAEELCRLLPS